MSNFDQHALAAIDRLIMNQQQDAASFASVLAVSLVGKFQAWNLVKHRLGWKILPNHQGNH